jgi:hypothetical protein
MRSQIASFSRLLTIASTIVACHGKSIDAKPDPTPASPSSSNSAKAIDPGLDHATVTTNRIEIPRAGHDPVVFELPVADVGDKKKNETLADILSVKAIVGESLDDVRAEAAAVTGPSDLALGVQGCSYEVTYNAHGVLQIDASCESMGAYPSGWLYHAVIDLREAKLLHARDAFRPEALAGLVARLDPLVVAEAKASDAAKDPDWASLVADAHYTTEDLDAFAVKDDGVTFFHAYQFPHVAEGLEPPGAYFQPWSSLEKDIAPEGALARIAHAKK